MKKKFNKIGFVILVLLLHSCGNQKPDNDEKITISKISIQIFPAFCTHSLLICDVTTGEIIFDMIDDVRYIKENSNYDIKPFYYKLSAEDAKQLGDSILGVFEECDYFDSFLDVEDGIRSDILFVFTDGKSKKLELTNSSTKNQSRLFSFLIKTVIVNCKDSTTIAYSKLLEKSYN